MAGQVLKVLLTSRIFDYSPLLEYSKEVPTAGIISSQLELEFTDGKRLLIGSQKPEQLDSAIEYYLKNYDKTGINIKSEKQYETKRE